MRILRFNWLIWLYLFMSLVCNTSFLIVKKVVSGKKSVMSKNHCASFGLAIHVNVDVNVDLCYTLSCELVGRLSNLKRWKLSNAHMPGRWRGGRWSEKCQLGRCTNQWWGEQAQTHQQDVLSQWFVDITKFFPDTTIFTIKNSRCELMT